MLLNSKAISSLKILPIIISTNSKCFRLKTTKSLIKISFSFLRLLSFTKIDFPIKILSKCKNSIILSIYFSLLVINSS